MQLLVRTCLSMLFPISRVGLAVSGNFVAAGAQFAEGTATGSSHGEVIVFKKGTGNSWTQTQKITGSQVAASDLL
jgi:hypothetical protein